MLASATGTDRCQFRFARTVSAGTHGATMQVASPIVTVRFTPVVDDVLVQHRLRPTRPPLPSLREPTPYDVQPTGLQLLPAMHVDVGALGDLYHNLHALIASAQRQEAQQAFHYDTVRHMGTLFESFGAASPTVETDNLLFLRCNEFYIAESVRQVAHWRCSPAGQRAPVAFVGFGGPCNYELMAAAQADVAIVIDRSPAMFSLHAELVEGALRNAGDAPQRIRQITGISEHTVPHVQDMIHRGRLIIGCQDATNFALLSAIGERLRRSGYNTVVYTSNIGDWVSGYCEGTPNPQAYHDYARAIEQLSQPNVPLVTAARAHSPDPNLPGQTVIMDGRMPPAETIIHGWMQRQLQHALLMQTAQQMGFQG